MKTPKNDFTIGLGYALGAQLLWGVFPLYLYLLKPVHAFDLVAHRIIWAFLLLAAYFGCRQLVAPRKNDRLIRPSKNGVQTAIVFAAAAILIGVNWVAFVWAVVNDKVLDASLGYYLCPQVNVLLGVLFLRERLSWPQWIAVGLAAVGVAWMAQSTTGFPWVSLVLAGAFGFYALIKKQVGTPALMGLTFETGYLFLPAVGFMLWRWQTAGQLPLGYGTQVNWLLVGIGLMTLAPLALYASALQHIRLSTVGLLQFITPTIQFAIGVFVFGEPFDNSKLIGFAFVWFGVVLYLLNLRRAMSVQPVE